MTTIARGTAMLTELECTLVDKVVKGEVLDLAPAEALPQLGNALPAINAWVIRDILLGTLAPKPDPRGLRLRGARIIGRLDLANVTSTMTVELSSCLLPDGLVARDANLADLTLNDCVLTHPSEPPLDGEGLRVAHSVTLAGSIAVGAGERGTIRLVNAHIGDLLNCAGATIRNETGPALQAEGMQVGQAMYLRDGCTAVGTGPLGAVRLIRAHISGQLECDGAVILNESGPAINADGLQIDQDMFLRNKFAACGAGASGTIRLPGAHIGGQLDCAGAVITNESGPALNADGLRVDQGVFLRDNFVAKGAGADVTLRLTNMTVGGRFTFHPAVLHHPNPAARTNVDGLVYTGLPRGIGVTEWLELLSNGTPAYAAQPYQQLAAAYRGAGQDTETRQVLMAQRRDQIQRKAVTSAIGRLWGRVTGLTLGYGYEPWRAVIGLLGVVLIAVTLTMTLGAHGGLAQPPPANSTTQVTTPCTTIDQIGVGLDFGTPLLSTGSSSRCHTTDTGPGQILTIVGLAAWAFATLFVAGFTGAVRRT